MDDLLAPESVKYAGRFRHHCQQCGRFVSLADARVAWDSYVAGYDADPYCPPGKGCRREDKKDG